MVKNNQILLAKRPQGDVKDNDFKLNESNVGIKDGEALVKIEYLSVDPAQRGWMNEGDSYLPAIELGNVVRALGVGVVVESKNGSYPVGTGISAMTGWQEYAVITKENTIAGQFNWGITKIPEGMERKKFLNEFGMVGLTAYFGLLDPAVGALDDKDKTVVVSGAAGAVGSLVGQIAKIKGKRVIGIAGGPEKVKVVKELGFDECVDYKNEDVAKRLKELAPNGICLYFDSVGGPTTDAVFSNMRNFGKVAACGAISGYNGKEGARQDYFPIIAKRLRVHGFIVTDHFKDAPKAQQEIQNWEKEGKLRPKEDIKEGFENIVPTFRRLFKGENIGKQLLKL
jgi:NADPH-dependent curcumin reductase CurA